MKIAKAIAARAVRITAFTSGAGVLDKVERIF
jgi:hypothetical protein